MIGVALDATGKAHPGKSGTVRTLFKQLLIHGVARSTNVRHRTDSRRRGSVVAVACGAGRCGNISTFHRGCVNALLVQLVLISGDLITLHVIRVCMAARASFGHVCGIHRCTGVSYRADVMDAVAVYAYGYLRISLLQALAVHAGEVFAHLVSAKARVELTHIVGIGVATAAERRNLRLAGSTPETLGRAHRIH